MFAAAAGFVVVVVVVITRKRYEILHGSFNFCAGGAGAYLGLPHASRWKTSRSYSPKY